MTWKKSVCFFGLFCSRGAICFYVVNWVTCQHADQTSAQVTRDLRSRHRISPQSTHFVPGKPSEYRWRSRRYHVDRWSREREIARGVNRSWKKTEKTSTFSHRRGIDNFLGLFSIHQWSNVFLWDAWPAFATYHRPSCDHRDPRVGRSL